MGLIYVPGYQLAGCWLSWLFASCHDDADDAVADAVLLVLMLLLLWMLLVDAAECK